MAQSHSHPPDRNPPSDNGEITGRGASRKLFVILPLAATILGAIYIFWEGRVESAQEITFPQFLDKLKMGEIDRKAGVVLISKPGAMRSVEGHLLNPPTAKVRAPIDLKDDNHLKTDLENQYGLVVTEKAESIFPWIRFFSR